jgi:hypothetical protein
MTIIDEIHERAPELGEHDLDEWIVPHLTDYYHQRIQSLARYAYSQTASRDGSALAYAAFRERAKAELRHGARTFLFVSEHWRNNRNIETYLSLCLKRLAHRVRIDAESTRKSNQPICPACKSLGEKQFCKYANKLLQCYACAMAIQRLEDQLKEKLAGEDRDRLEGEIRLRKIFQTHSRRGRRCPDCHRFIPETFLQQYGVSCPYPDCCFYGTESELEPMAHPLALSFDAPLSLNQPIFKVDEKHGPDWITCFEAEEVNADVRMEIRESCARELEILKQVIDDQMARTKRNEDQGRAMLKLLMYEAYRNLVERQPEDMIRYLVHMRHSGELPVQATIFQEYVRLVENSLPFTIARGRRKIEICSLLDPNLNLFLGESQFEATVRSDNMIPNNTVETYTGGRKLKFFGPCFIGLLTGIDHRDTGESLLDKVKNYSFVRIKMDESVPEGTPVIVTHFRIASHYEMGGLVHLQRIRRQIVDSVFFRLHGRKRTVGDDLDETNQEDS